MQNHKNKASGLTRSLWMGLAMFFVIFSCPVKKYIRMQLYKQFPPIESTADKQLGIPEGKECGIADKHNQTIAIPVAPAPMLSGSDGLLLFILPALIFNVFLFISKRTTEAASVLYGHDPGGGAGILPRYLRFRHIQV